MQALPMTQEEKDRIDHNNAVQGKLSVKDRRRMQRLYKAEFEARANLNAYIRNRGGRIDDDRSRELYQIHAKVKDAYVEIRKRLGYLD